MSIDLSSDMLDLIAEIIFERLELEPVSIGGWMDCGHHIDADGAIETRRIIILMTATDGPHTMTCARDIQADARGIQVTLATGTDMFDEAVRKEQSACGS